MDWIRLSINATHEAVDWVPTLLAAKGYTGEIHILPHPAIPLETDSDSAHSIPEWAFKLHLHLQNQTGVHPGVHEIIDWLSSLVRVGLITIEPPVAIAEGTPLPVETSAIARLGTRFVVVSPTTPYTAQAEEIVLKLEPGLAFGSGLHPTTGLAVRSLEKYVLPGMTVLDFGSGTGILSVVLAKLGATVVALDNDRHSVAATRRMVQHNSLERQVTVMEGSLGKGGDLGHWMGGDVVEHVPALTPAASFDLIVTNNLARVHIALAEEFRDALRHDRTQAGLLITSGFTTDYEDDVNAALLNAGFEMIGCERSNTWVALVHRLIVLQKLPRPEPTNEVITEPY